MVDKKLELGNSILESLPVVKELFVNFYGEEYREMIEKRFDNCHYIGYCLPDTIKYLLKQLEEEKSKELISSFLRKNDLEDKEDTIKKYFSCYGSSLGYLSITPLGNLYKGLDDLNKKEQIIEIARSITGNTQLQDDTDEFDEFVKKVKSMRVSYDEMIAEFNRFQDKYSKYRDYVDSCSQVENKIRNKYKNVFLREISEYLSEHDKKVIDDTNGDINVFYLDCFNVWCSSFYAGSTLIDSFSSKSNEKINNPNARRYEIDNIFSDRIRFFNKHGIELGNDYSMYMNDERCLRLIPNVDIVDKIIRIREELASREREEYITSTSQYGEQLKEIESLGLIDSNVSYTCENVLSGITCVNPNIKKANDGSIQLYNLLLFSGRCSTDYFDKNFIHECNHLVETELVYADDKKYVVRSGWDFLDCAINVNEDDSKKREFEELNEIINELLAQKLTEILHSRGIYLFDDKESSKVRGGTSYEKNRFLVQEFYNSYIDDIKYSRMTGDMDKLYEKVGKDNLLELNKLVSDFSSYFGEFKLYQTYSDLKNGIDTDDVKFYYECIERRNILFAKMEEVNFNYMNNNSFAK